MERKADEKKILQIKELMKKRDTDISFNGKVLDQNNNTVDGASVEVHISHFSPDINEYFCAIKEISIRTDKTGLFSVEKERGENIYINGISKPGYEYILQQNTNRSFEYFNHGIQKPFVPDKNNPIIFRLRKQKDATFLLENIDWNCHISSNESGTARGYDFIRQTHVRNLAKPVLNGEPLVCDILGKATFNTNDAKWTVVLAPGNTNGGIIASDQLLYEAPQNGYQLEYVFVPEDRKPKPKYIYLRSRDPAIYTRIEITHVTAIKEYFNLKGKSVTNPYGDRNLEKALNLPYEVTKQLTDEVKSCFRKNKRPSKPDLPKLIREVQKENNIGM